MIIYLGCARSLELIRWNQNRDDNSEHQPVRLQLRISSAYYRKILLKKIQEELIILTGKYN